MSRRTPLSLVRSAGGLAKALAALLVVLVAVGGFRIASATSPTPGPAKAAIVLLSTPASQNVVRGRSVAYAVSVTSAHGFAGTVQLRVSGLPGRASAGFTRASVPVRPGVTAGSTLMVTTSPSTALGTVHLTVTGTSGKLSTSSRFALTVVASSIAVAATPASVTMSSAAVAVYRVSLYRTNYVRAVRFAVTGLPSGAHATFSPNPTSGSRSSLQVTTAAGLKDGTYHLTVTASGSGVPTASTGVQLILRSPGRPFTIGGSVAGLSPGASPPLNLSLTNPNNKPIWVTNLTVTIQAVTRSTAAVSKGLPCSTADYSIVQYSGPYPLTVPRSASVTLAGLGVSPSAQPHVRMLNTASNQDGCKGATVSLRFTGFGLGS